MTFAYPEISGCFDLGDGKLHTLIIEHPALLRRLLADVRGQINGEKGKAVVAGEAGILELAKYVEVLDSFIPFDLNRKSLLSKITLAMEKCALSPEHYEDSMKIMGEIESFLHRLAFDFPCDIIFPKCSLSGLLRFSSPELREEYDSLAEKVLDYMELVTEFDRPKLFLTVNLRSYLEDSVFSLFADTLLSHGYQILMIENYEKTRIPQEERRIIFKLQYQIGQL